jgi:hypothetical protein
MIGWWTVAVLESDMRGHLYFKRQSKSSEELEDC